MDHRYLDLLAEECAEVIQAVMKIKRFGIDDKYPDGRTGREALMQEISEVLVIVDHLNLSEADEMILVNHPAIKEEKLKIYGPDGSYFNVRKGNSNG